MTVLDKKSKESGQKDFQLDHQEIEILPEETLGPLRASGVSEEQIYIKRMVDPEQCFTYCHCTETLI